MTGNMDLWKSVEKTDPSHTKKVNQRGGFTSISAQYQVMKATEAFGPVGTGWGYDCGAPIFQGEFVIIPVTVWYRDRANKFGPVYGCAEFTGKRPDSDAPKKAMTDALTKALSHLGFNADVFLGKFDDNKYVAEVTLEFREQSAEAAPAFDPKAAHDRILNRIQSAADFDALLTVWDEEAATVRKVGETERPLGLALYNARDERRAHLAPKEAA